QWVALIPRYAGDFMRNALLALIALAALATFAAPQSNEFVKPGDNFVVENIPPIPVSIAEQTQRYDESRAAALLDWHPTRHEMLIGTRFADVNQVHWVKMPRGERQQMTFFPDRVLGAQFEPHGRYFIFMKDIGGGEWYQYYRFNPENG